MLFGDSREVIVGFAGAEGELLAARLPSEFFDKEFGEITLLQERTGAMKVRDHGDEL